MNALPNFFRIYKCDKDEHYHILTTSGDISCPFWTWAGGLLSVDHLAYGEIENTPKIHIPHLCNEITRIKGVIRDIEGECFTKIGSPQPREYMVPEAWIRFVRGNNQTASYRSSCGEKAHELPFICDFVERIGDSDLYSAQTKETGRRLLRKLARKTATLRSVEVAERYKRLSHVA